jgi:hypothetical protein
VCVYPGSCTDLNSLAGNECTDEACSSLCRIKLGQQYGSKVFGCQIPLNGTRSLAFCECGIVSSSSASQQTKLPNVVCDELAVCSESAGHPSCLNGYCSTSPTVNDLFDKRCVACNSGLVLTPDGACIEPEGADSPSLFLFTRVLTNDLRMY